MIFEKTSSNPSTDTGKAQSVTIGDITISQFCDGSVWLESEIDGDAGSFDEAALAAAIKGFYNTHL